MLFCNFIDIGAFEYGRFVAAYTIVAGLFGIVEQVITALYQPKIYRGLTSSSIRLGLVQWNKSVEALIVYLIAVSGLLLLVEADLILVVYGNIIGDIGPYLKLALLLEFSRVIAGTMLFYFQISKTTSKIFYYYLVAIPLALVFLNMLPWQSIIESWVLSITLGCCGGLVLIMALISRQNAFVKISYVRIITAVVVSSACLFTLNSIAKKMLDNQSPVIFLLTAVTLYLTIFIASDFFVQKFILSEEDSEAN